MGGVGSTKWLTALGRMLNSARRCEWPNGSAVHSVPEKLRRMLWERIWELWEELRRSWGGAGEELRKSAGGPEEELRRS